ncbi:hypothetical protein [Candidatus Binatus sp.]|uniref:hypothetical protein n=1 Tax=Candidatus Binatus sp. TaxID=2811406 RepID=UPI003CC5E893
MSGDLTQREHPLRHVLAFGYQFHLIPIHWLAFEGCIQSELEIHRDRCRLVI